MYQSQNKARQPEGNLSSAPTPDRTPDSVRGRLDNLIYGLNGAHHAAEQIAAKLFGAIPESGNSAIGTASEPGVSEQIDMLLGKVEMLQRQLENIAQAI